MMYQDARSWLPSIGIGYRFVRSGFLGFALATFLVGCTVEEGVPRYDVSGKVAFNGEPVPAGSVRFRPDRLLGNEGPSGYALILDGHYDTSMSDRGTTGGPQVVEISGYDGKAAPEMEMGMPLFNGFYTKVDLPRETTTLDFDVPRLVP